MQPNQAARIEMALRSLGFQARVQGRPLTDSPALESIIRTLEGVAEAVGGRPIPTIPDLPPMRGPGTGLDGAPLRWKDEADG